MNARIVNLRTRRKQKARDEKRKAAGDGPAPGVSKFERDRSKAENRRARNLLEGGRLGDGRLGDGRLDDQLPDDEG